MRADFHIHTQVSPDSFMSPETLVKACLRAGLDTIAVTDHHTIRGALEVQKIAPFPVIVGAEFRTAEGEIIGLFLKEDVPRRISALETVKLIKAQGGLVQIPHPFDFFRRKHIKYDALLEVLPYVDIIEAFNARTTLKGDIMKSVRFIQEHKVTHNHIVPTGVTDSHTPFEIGHAYVDMPSFKGPHDFLDALRHGRIVGRQTTPLIHVATRWTVYTKRLGLLGKVPARQ